MLHMLRVPDYRHLYQRAGWYYAREGQKSRSLDTTELVVAQMRLGPVLDDMRAPRRFDYGNFVVEFEYSPAQLAAIDRIVKNCALRWDIEKETAQRERWRDARHLRSEVVRKSRRRGTYHDYTTSAR